MKTVNIGLLVGIAVLAMVGLSLFAFWGSSMNASKYTTFAEAKATGEEVHVVGSWVMQDRQTYEPSKDLFSFYLQDTTGDVSLVNFYDPMPPNFKSAERVVVQGKYESNVFVADKIFMKCPSKYNNDEFMESEAQAVR